MDENKALYELIDSILEQNFEFEVRNEILNVLKNEGINTVRDIVGAEVAQTLWKLLPGGLTGNAKVVGCSMPHNNASVAQSAATQCQGTCESYFCKKHSISKCPVCGGNLK